jgi:hypothetical protein
MFEQCGLPAAKSTREEKKTILDPSKGTFPGAGAGSIPILSFTADEIR